MENKFLGEKDETSPQPSVYHQDQSLDPPKSNKHLFNNLNKCLTESSKLR